MCSDDLTATTVQITIAANGEICWSNNHQPSLPTDGRTQPDLTVAMRIIGRAVTRTLPEPPR